jgi:hypothetical protein
MNKKKKTEKSHKEKMINVRCTEQQKTDLESVAARTGLGVSTWLLHLGLEKFQEQQEKDRR